METKLEMNMDDFKRVHEPVIKLDKGRLAVREGYVIDTQFADDEKPERVILSERFTNAADFVDYVNEYKEAGTKAFYNDDSVRVVFNYSLPDAPNFSDSRVSLVLEKTTVFNSFIREVKGNSRLSQKGLIKFLKQMEASITSHDGITLYNIMENLKAVKDVNSISKNTEKGIVLNIKVDSGISNVSVPERVKIELPLYKAQPELKTAFEIEFFYDYDDNHGFVVELACWDFEQVVEDATRAIVQSIVNCMDGVKAYRI